MSRIFIDGYESGSYDLYDLSHAAAAVVSSAGLDMNGNYCLDCRTAYAYVKKTITATDEIYFAFLWRPDSTTALQPIMSIQDGSTHLGTIYRVGSNISARRSTGTIVGTGTATLSDDTTYLIEVYFKLADSGGRFVVKVGSVIDVDYTGDTNPGAGSTFNHIQLGFISSFQQPYAYFDNLIIDTSAWIGETFIQAVVPTGIGNSSVWTPSAGNNYACVDEIPANDADYVESSAADDIDTYITGDVAVDTDIKCVQIQTRCKVEVGVSKNIKFITRVNGTNYLSGDKVVSSGAVKSLFNVWENNPADAAAWERADVNGMEIGAKSGATTNTIRNYQTLAQIEWIEKEGITVKPAWYYEMLRKRNG